MTPIIFVTFYWLKANHWFPPILKDRELYTSMNPKSHGSLEAMVEIIYCSSLHSAPVLFLESTRHCSTSGPLPQMFCLECSSHMAYSTPLSLCSNVTFTVFLWSPYLKLHQPSPLVTLPCYIFLRNTNHFHIHYNLLSCLLVSSH